MASFITEIVQIFHSGYLIADLLSGNVLFGNGLNCIAAQKNKALMQTSSVIIYLMHF